MNKKNDKITPAVLLDHMQGMKHEIVQMIKRLDTKIDRVEARLNTKIDRVEVRLNQKFDNLENRLTAQIENMDRRLDTIEIAIVEKKHEKRIFALEKHAGLVQR